jgi:hypothetical protein
MKGVNDLLLNFPSAMPITKDISQSTPKDVRELSLESRWELNRGDTVELFLGDSAMLKVPKAALMAFSSDIKASLVARQDATGIQFPPEDVSEVAFRAVMDFILGNIRFAKTVDLKPGASLSETIQIYHFGLLLGWSKQDYLHEIYLNIAKDIMNKEQIIGYEELDEILELPMDDPVYRCTVAVFDNLRRKDQIGDIKKFNAWLKHYPEFEAAMANHRKNVKPRHISRQLETQLELLETSE